MGGQVSKFQVIENKNLNGHTSDSSTLYLSDDDDDQDCTCFSFCRIKNSEKGGKKTKSKKNDDFLGTPLPEPRKPLASSKSKKKIMMGNKNNDLGLFLERERSMAMLGGLSKGMEKEEEVESNNDTLNHPYLLDPITAQIHYTEHLSEKYSLCEVLGVGSTSTCYRCVNNATGDSYACKMIDKKFIATHYQGMASQFQSEILALKALQHPNIISLYDVYYDSDRIYIVMELMHGGELFDYVVERGTLSEPEAADIMKKITSALDYIHSKNIIHRDLKPENLLLLRKPLTPYDVEVKIIDFGLSKQLETQPGGVAGTFLGTRGYLAPEMLQRLNYSCAVDAWALGVILYVLLCGCLPFDDDSQPLSSADALKARFVLRYPRWARNLSNDAKDLLSHLLDIDPNVRYTAQRALNHEWMTNITQQHVNHQKPLNNQKPTSTHQYPPQPTTTNSAKSSVAHKSHRRVRSHSDTNSNPEGNRRRSYSDQSVTNEESVDTNSSHLERSIRSRPRRVRKFHATKKSVDI